MILPKKNLEFAIMQGEDAIGAAKIIKKVICDGLSQPHWIIKVTLIEQKDVPRVMIYSDNDMLLMLNKGTKQ